MQEKLRIRDHARGVVTIAYALLLFPWTAFTMSVSWVVFQALMITSFINKAVNPCVELDEEISSHLYFYRRSIDGITLKLLQRLRWYTEKYLGARIIYHGDAIPEKSNVLIVSTHTRNQDYFANFFSGMDSGNAQWIRFVAKKDVLWQYPFINLIMLMKECIFLTRKNREEDVKQLQEFAKKSVQDKIGNFLILYPEGTRYKDGVRKERNEQHGYEYETVMAPKPRGFIELVQNMRSALDYVAFQIPFYRDQERTTWWFLCGRSGEMVVYNKVVKIEDLPQSESELKKYLIEMFYWLDKMKLCLRDDYHSKAP